MKIIISLILPIIITGYVQAYQVIIDSFTAKKACEIIQHQVKWAGSHNPGDIINHVSYQFLSTPYVANTLIGSPTDAEKVVVNFKGVDCFTFLDYVESLRKSDNKNIFIDKLIQTRYVGNKVSFLSRKHFFTDWVFRGKANAKDITAEISPHYMNIKKALNKKPDGDELIAGLGVINRTITYIPGDKIDSAMLNNLKTGDYIGIYTHIPWLDTTHTGIFIMTKRGPMFRNASSREAHKQVIDLPFLDYMKKVPGIIVFRPI